MSKVAVVLLNLGGPSDLKSVKPFLFNLFNDPAIIRLPKWPRYLLAWLISTLRHKKAMGIYERLGGKSPLLENTLAQSSALDFELQEHGIYGKTFVCMRYWHPMAPEVVADIMKQRFSDIVLLPLYPQYSTTTTQSSIDDFKAHFEAYGGYDIERPKIHEIGCYPVDDLFIDAMCDVIKPCVEESLTYGRPYILFSAHGLPESVIADGDPYQYQVEAASNRIMNWLSVTFEDAVDAHICYQSRVGPKKWIGPSTDEMIIKAAQERRPLIVVPISFVSDHSETLVELDMDYAELAMEKGAAHYMRVPSLATHPSFIACLIKLVKQSLNGQKLPICCQETFKINEDKNIVLKCACARMNEAGDLK